MIQLGLGGSKPNDLDLCVVDNVLAELCGHFSASVSCFVAFFALSLELSSLASN